MAKFKRDRRANVAITAGLLALPLTGLIGLAIDFGHATAAKAQIDIAADAAALLATTTASNAYLSGAPDPIGPAQLAGKQRFMAQAGSQAGVVLGTVDVAVQQVGTRFTSTIIYQGAVQTHFGRLFGVASIALGGQTGAALTVNPYVDIHVLMDVSSSMAIAATTADVAKMESLNHGCAFACHSSATGHDDYYLAHQNGVRLRIDDLQSAVSNLINKINGFNTHATFRVGLYTIAQSFKQIFPLSSKVSSAASVTDQIAPDVNDCTSNCPDTYLNEGMANVASVIGRSGDGTAAATPLKFLLVVTDGVEDANIAGTRTIGPISQSACDQVKSQGVTVLTLYTPYLPPETFNQYYHDHVEPFQPNLAKIMQSCASSPSQGYQVSDSVGIDTQLQQMLAAVLLSSGHLTQ